MYTIPPILISDIRSCASALRPFVSGPGPSAQTFAPEMKAENQDVYKRQRYKSNTGDCTMHFIREETLKRFVLRRIFEVTALSLIHI